MAQFDVETWYESPDGSTSVAFIYLDGCNPSGVNSNLTSEITYQVVAGEALFCVNGIKHLVECGQEIVVPRGSRYSDYGKKAAMLATSVPAFKK